MQMKLIFNCNLPYPAPPVKGTASPRRSAADRLPQRPALERACHSYILEPEERKPEAAARL